MVKKKTTQGKEKENLVEKEVASNQEAISPSDFIVNSTEEEEKDHVLAILEESIKFLEETGGSKEMLRQFISAKKKLS